MIKLLFFGLCILLIAGFVLADVPVRDAGAGVGVGIGERECISDWSCNKFSDCVDNVQACVEVVDNNACGFDFDGKIEDFNVVDCRIPDCTPDWQCSKFFDCSVDNVLECVDVSDNNLCGTIFDGVLTDFNQDCVFVDRDVVLRDFFANNLFRAFGNVLNVDDVVVMDRFVDKGVILDAGLNAGFKLHDEKALVNEDVVPEDDVVYNKINIARVQYDNRDVTVIYVD